MISSIGMTLIATTAIVRYVVCPDTEDGSRDLLEFVFVVGCALFAIGFLPTQ